MFRSLKTKLIILLVDNGQDFLSYFDPVFIVLGTARKVTTVVWGSNFQTETFIPQAMFFCLSYFFSLYYLY